MELALGSWGLAFLPAALTGSAGPCRSGPEPRYPPTALLRTPARQQPLPRRASPPRNSPLAGGPHQGLQRRGLGSGLLAALWPRIPGSGCGHVGRKSPTERPCPLCPAPDAPGPRSQALVAPACPGSLLVPPGRTRYAGEGWAPCCVPSLDSRHLPVLGGHPERDPLGLGLHDMVGGDTAQGPRQSWVPGGLCYKCAQRLRPRAPGPDLPRGLVVCRLAPHGDKPAGPLGCRVSLCGPADVWLRPTEARGQVGWSRGWRLGWGPSTRVGRRP